MPFYCSPHNSADTSTTMAKNGTRGRGGSTPPPPVDMDCKAYLMITTICKCLKVSLIALAVIEGLLTRLLNVRQNARRRSVRISLPEVRELCRGAEIAFLAEPSLLEIQAPIKVCGRSKVNLEELNY